MAPCPWPPGAAYGPASHSAVSPPARDSPHSRLWGKVGALGQPGTSGSVGCGECGRGCQAEALRVPTFTSQGSLRTGICGRLRLEAGGGTGLALQDGVGPAPPLSRLRQEASGPQAPGTAPSWPGHQAG